MRQGPSGTDTRNRPSQRTSPSPPCPSTTGRLRISRLIVTSLPPCHRQRPRVWLPPSPPSEAGEPVGQSCGWPEDRRVRPRSLQDAPEPGGAHLPAGIANRGDRVSPHPGHRHEPCGAEHGRVRVPAPFAFRSCSGTTLRNTLPAQSDTGEPGVSVHGIVEPVFAPLPKRRFQTCGMDSEKRSEDPQRRSFDTARHAGQTHRSAAGFKAQGNRLLMVLAMVCGEKVQNAVVATGSLEKMIACLTGLLLDGACRFRPAPGEHP